MAKQLESLFEDFLKTSPTEQLNKIAEIRHSRTIERPVAAKKRVKKEGKKKATNKSKVKTLLRDMSPEQQAALLEALEGKANEDN